MGCTPFVKLFRAWKRLQVSYYGGKYSVERMLALHAYSSEMSTGHVLFVCLVTPLPVTVYVALEELVPLQSPRAGWRENYGFWVRTMLLAFIVGHTITRQATYMIDGVTISERRLMVLSICASLSFMATFGIPITSHFMFPVPFFILLMAPLFYVMLIISFRVVVGSQILYQILRQRRQSLRYVCFVVAQVLLAFLYPGYEALFRQAQGSQYQLAVILFLPILKVAVKNVMLQCISHMEDMMPEAVIFTVDFFNAIYIATCMQSATSAAAVTAITVTDLGQTIVMVYGLHRRTATILSRLRRGNAPTDIIDNIVTALNALCEDPQRFENQARSSIAIYSSLPHRLSPEKKTDLDALANVPIRSQQHRSIRSTGVEFLVDLNKSNLCCFGTRSRAIHPIISGPATTTLVRFKNKQGRKHKVSSQQSTTVLRDSLEILFTLECLVATAYVEALMPFFYSSYVAVMVHLPSARYHTELTGVTPQNVGSTVFPVLIFGLLQVVSFVLLTMVIKRNCGMWTIHQLSFLLETQMPLIQGKLMLWMVLTVCFRIVHFGVDFTFRFDQYR